MDQMRNMGLIQGLIKFWGNLTGTQRFITVVFISTSIVVLSLISVLATKPQMTVLFSGLQSEDAGAVIAKLQEKKIPYEIDGTTIKIPEKNIAETRMDLASQGLPKGGAVGFELFDKTSLGMTDFAQRLNYQRALQGELSRSIDELDGVQNSRIHIVIPEHSVFVQNDKQPTASVIVKLRPGASLNSEQVSGIVHLVSSAVEGLKPNAVTIVDTNGNELSGPTDDSEGLDPRMGSSQMNLKRSHERQMEKDIQSMLERVLGQNKAVVRVNARINFDRVEQSSETYQPLKNNQGVLSSESQVHESYVGSDKNAAMKGQVAAAGTANAPKGGYDRLETSNKYEISRNTQHTVKAPGQIERLSVAVMVDGDVDSAKKIAITNAVTMAAGIDLTRGDQIRVENMKFDDSAAKASDAEMKSLTSRDFYMNIGKMAGAILLVLGILLFARTVVSKVNMSIPSGGGIVVHELTTGPETGSLPAEAAQAYGRSPAASHVNMTTSNHPIQAEPEEVAQVLRKWLSEV